jgi:hypothetical protein
MATRMQQRRGTAAQWTSANPILAAGEIGFETDSGKFKMGNGSSAWSALSYFADSSDFDTTAIESTIDSKVATAVNNLVAGAPAALDTLNEIASAINNDGSFATTIINSLNGKATQTYVDTHINATTNIHGIADASALATQTYVTDTISSSLAPYSDTTQVNGLITTALSDYSTTASTNGLIATALDDYSTTAETNGLIADALDPYSDTTETLGLISGALADYSTTATIQANYSTTSDTNTEIASQITTHSLEGENVHGISNTANLVYTDDSRLSDTRTPSNDSVTTATIVDGAVTPAKIEDSAVTTAKLDVSAVTTVKIADSNVTADKLASDSVTTAKILDGAVTSAKIADGAIVNADINASAAIDWTKLAVSSTVSATEIGYVDGVTSSIQTQLDGKAASSHTHAQSDITNLTTDLAAKAPLASPTFTGTVTAADVTINGNLTVEGTTTTVNATDLVVSDPLIYVGEGNTANLVDLGIVSSFNNGTYQHSGIARDASDNKWKFFKGVTDEPTTTINFAQGSLDDLAVNNVTVAGVVFTDGTQTKEGVPSRTPIVQKTAAYTLSSLTERDNLIEVSSASAVSITVPTNASVAYPVGTSIDILQTGAGQVSIVGASGVTVNCTPSGGSNTAKLRTQWSSATLFKRAADTWVVMGDLTA